jgi:hypothetical protein
MLDWLNRGVRLGSNSTWPGDVWTSANVSDIITALDRVQAVLGDATDAALGLGGGGTLGIIKIRAGRDDPGAIGGKYYGGLNRIELFLTDTAEEGASETAVHEMGHAVDWHAGSSGFWSASSGGWLAATGWRHNAEYGFWTSSSTAGAPTLYASTGGAIEDFAETFTWYTENTAPGAGGYNDAFKGIDRTTMAKRLNQLNVALGQFP